LDSFCCRIFLDEDKSKEFIVWSMDEKSVKKGGVWDRMSSGGMRSSHELFAFHEKSGTNSGSQNCKKQRSSREKSS
jgi:hypothetical protein